MGRGVARLRASMKPSPGGQGAEAGPAPGVLSPVTPVPLCFSSPQAPPASVRCRMAPLPTRWTSRGGNSPQQGRRGGHTQARGGSTGLTREEEEAAGCHFASDNMSMWFHRARAPLTLEPHRQPGKSPGPSTYDLPPRCIRRLSSRDLGIWPGPHVTCQASLTEPILGPRLVSVWRPCEPWSLVGGLGGCPAWPLQRGLKQTEAARALWATAAHGWPGRAVSSSSWGRPAEEAAPVG